MKKGVRLEILIDDKTLAGINSAKGNLNMLENVYKQILAQLNKELKALQQNLKSSLEQGINTDKQVAEVQALTGVINDLTDSLEELEQAKKKGNSSSIIQDETAPKLGNIKRSISQIAGELPSLAMGPKMFFLAISNNIEPLREALGQARDEFDSLTKKGKEATPVWKQVAKAIVSPQAALAIATTLFVVYGDEIIAFAKKMITGKREVISMKEAVENLNEEFNNNATDLAKSVTTVNNLSKEYRNLGDDMNAKKEFITKNKEEFDKLDVSINNVADADKLLINSTDAYIEAMTLRAEATAAYNLQVEAQEELIKKQRATEKRKNEGPTFRDKAQSFFVSAMYMSSGQGAAPTAKDYQAEGVKAAKAEEDAVQAEVDAYQKLYEEKSKASKQILERLGLMTKEFDLNKQSANTTNYAAELAEARIKAQQKLERMLIETMQDGFKKRQALAAQQLQEEIARINADEKAQLDTIKKARAAGQSVDTNAEQQVQDNAQQQRKAANNKYLQDSAQIEKEWQENSLQSWIAYYEKYGTYAQQRVAIIQKYALKMNNTQDENEKALFTKQQEEELQSLDDKFGKSVKQMTDLFEDASKKSVGAIEEIISKYEKLIDYMTNPDSNVTKEDLLAVDFTEKDLKDLENGTIKIADITKALKELKGELKGKSPFKTFSTDLKEAFDKIKNAKGDTKAIGEGLSGIGSAVSSFTPALQQFSSDISTIFGFDDSKIQGIIGAVDGLGNTAVGIGQALSGDIVGGAMKAVSGIASVVSSLEGVFGADYSGYERLKEQYELLNGVWDTLIDKKKEYISMSYGEEATKAGEEAKKLINDQINRYRQLLDDLAGSGASIGSHSLGYRINKRMAKEDWEILSKLVGETIDNSNDLWDLTADQLEKLLQDPKIVSVLGEVNEDFLTYIQDIIDAQDELEEVEKSIQEQLTQTSFENMQDSFWNALLDMEKDAEAFGDDLTKTMQKAIIKANLGKTYESQLQNWYEKFAKANQSDGINTEEYDSLRKEYDAIVEAALKERNELMKVFGWESEAAASAAQSGRAGAVTTITEETAGRLEGIGNAQLDRIIAMDVKMENMGDSLSAMASNIAIMTENSNYLKRLEDIADNIQNMNSTGVKIKG